MQNSNVDNKIYENLIVTSAPHIVRSLDTQKIMVYVLLALAPALAVSIYVFGLRVLILTLVCVVSCVAFEFFFCKIARWENSIPDLSAIVTGVILAFNLPSNFPYWMAVIGCFIAIVIVKEFFGGLGQNFVNPAVTARIVLFLSFTTEMTSWPVPRGSQVDGLTGPTPLALLGESGSHELPSNLDAFFGTIGGSLGEVSALALLLGGVFLIVKKIISPLIPLVYIATVFVFAFAIGQDPFFHIFTGGLMLGAFFCATDYVTSPMLPWGKVAFAVGCGVITLLIRVYGAYPEGVSFAILLMNILSPGIDHLCMKIFVKGGKKNAKTRNQK